MMKSFFKKLAFVMALAMVVTAMAPAATASAADALGIVAQADTTWTVLETGEVAVGATVDYRYKGAPENYKELDPTWASSDETVATVDKNGVVTGLKDGEVVISISLSNGQKGEIALKVGKGAEASKAFEVKQVTSNSVELIFTDAASATKDVTVTKLGKTTSGDVTEITWPVNKVEVKDNKATVTTWVDFGTGSYRFTANGVSEDKDTAVGYPYFAVIVYKNAYSYAEGGAITPEITVYDENGVKLSGYNNWYFELVNADANAYVDANGLLYLWAVGAKAQIKATLSYVVGTETKTVDCPVEVVCVAKPEYVVNNYLEKYAVTNAAAADKITWGKTDVIIDNGSYYVAGIVKDSDSKTKSISSKSVDNNNGKLDESKYYVRYASSNPTVALVHEVTGEVLGVNVGKAYALVTLYKVNASDRTKDQSLGVIAAVPVDVCAAKKADSLVLDKYGETLLTSGHFTTVTVTTTTKDQYKEDLTDDFVKSVYVKHNDKTYSNTNGYVTVTGNKFTIDASKFEDVNANSLNFLVETDKGVKANFVLTLKKVPGNGKVNQQYALSLKGAEIGTDPSKLTASVEVVSAWAGSSLYKTAFYFGKPEVCEYGDLYVTITGPDGKDLATQAGTHAALEFTAIDPTSSATAGAIKPMAVGNYVVKLNRVTQVATGSDNKQIVNVTVCDTKNFEIKNSLKSYSNFKVKNNKYTTADYIWTDNVEFKIGDTAWNGTNFKLVHVNKKVLNDSVFVYDFTVRVDYGTAGAYYDVKIPVNQLFTK